MTSYSLTDDDDLLTLSCSCKVLLRLVVGELLLVLTLDDGVTDGVRLFDVIVRRGDYA